MADIPGYSARILVNGRKVKEYNHEGNVFIESRLNTEYEIEIKNHNSNRVMAIVSVDGLDVIKGKPATNYSSGYIIKGYDSIRVKGFRKDSETVGSFKFTDRKNSYSKSQGNGGNQGIIAVRFIEEHVDAFVGFSTPVMDFNSIDTQPYYTKIGHSVNNVQAQGSSIATYSAKIGGQMRSLKKSCSTEIQPTSFDMGTTWGSKQKDKVKETEFERGNVIGEVNLYYASRKSLIDMGVPLINEKLVALPQGFQDFCEPPKGWQ